MTHMANDGPAVEIDEALQNTGKWLRMHNHFWSKVLKSDGCWEWRGSLNQDGYGTFYWMRKGTKAHRAAWRLAKGEIPDGMQVLHRCDNPPCVNPEHLFLGTHADNMRDRTEKGRAAPTWHDYRGSRNPRAKVTEAQARRVKYGGESVTAIASELGISRNTLYSIRNGRNWRHI